MAVSPVTSILKTMETSSSIGMFARDTGGCLIARLGVARSFDEAREISFAEISESAAFYFAAPLLAKGTADIFAKSYGVNKDTFKKSITKLAKSDTKTLQKVKRGKFAQIFTVFGLMLPAVFGIAPLRNLLTYSETGKEKFTNVVELEKTKKIKHRKEAERKAIQLTKTLALCGSIGIASGIGLALSGKNPKIYNKLEPLYNKVYKHLDFTKEGDLTLKHYSALIYPASIAGYFYASRDKYEKLENARRFAITVPLLFWGEKLIQNPIYRFFDKKFGTKVRENGEIKTYKEILKLPKEKQMKFLKTKNLAYSITFFTNTMAIAVAVALLNRIATKNKFQKDKSKSLT